MHRSFKTTSSTMPTHVEVKKPLTKSSALRTPSLLVTSWLVARLACLPKSSVTLHTWVSSTRQCSAISFMENSFKPSVTMTSRSRSISKQMNLSECTTPRDTSATIYRRPISKQHPWSHWVAEALHCFTNSTTIRIDLSLTSVPTLASRSKYMMISLTSHNQRLSLASLRSMISKKE